MAIGGLYRVKNPMDTAMQGMERAAGTYGAMTKATKTETEPPPKTVGGAIMNVGGAALSGYQMGTTIGGAAAGTAAAGTLSAAGSATLGAVGGGAAAGAGAGAATGASTGSMAGPYSAAIGAAVGLLAYMLSG